MSVIIKDSDGNEVPDLSALFGKVLDKLPPPLMPGCFRKVWYEDGEIKVKDIDPNEVYITRAIDG